MNDDLSWAKWWACPWGSAHTDWLTLTGFVETATLSRSHHVRASNLFGIKPELPPPMSAALLRLVRATPQQRDLILTLVNEVYNAPHDSRLSQEQLLWCQRLAKALPPGPAPLSIDDPLHYLRAWVTPAIWQRLRLSFAHRRVLELDQSPKLEDAQGRLDILWQAAIWRATSTSIDDALHTSREISKHVLHPQN